MEDQENCRRLVGSDVWTPMGGDDEETRRSQELCVRSNFDLLEICSNRL